MGNIDKIKVSFFHRPYVWNDVQFDAPIRSFTDTTKEEMPFWECYFEKTRRLQ